MNEDGGTLTRVRLHLRQTWTNSTINCKNDTKVSINTHLLLCIAVEILLTRKKTTSKW